MALPQIRLPYWPVGRCLLATYDTHTHVLYVRVGDSLAPRKSRLMAPAECLLSTLGSLGQRGRLLSPSEPLGNKTR